MNIIIVGCGQVGETLAVELAADGNDITVIDLSGAKIKALSERLDIMGIVGNGATHTVQIEAGVESADLLISVTDSDELNLLCCMIAKRHSNCQVIARVKNPVYSKESAYLKDELGLAMVINPELAAAEEIARILRFPAATQIETFSKGRVELLKFRLPIDSVLVGMSVKRVNAELKTDVLICTVEREDGAHIVNGDFVFESRDLISIVASPKNAQDFFKKIGYKGKPIKDAFILGSTAMTYYLCEMLTRAGISLKVISSNKERCESLSETYPSVTVINSDETDRALLVEEGIDKASAVLALTKYDEENILLSLAARSYGVSKTITNVNKTEYSDITKNLELDTVIYPKNIAADMIMRFVRAMRSSQGSNVEAMYTFIKGNEEVEATEFIVNDGSPVVDIPLAELGPKLKSDVLVCAILRRDGSVITPHGQDSIGRVTASL
jgi:trk system potassium uptake protein TrkA